MIIYNIVGVGDENIENYWIKVCLFYVCVMYWNS